ncbi:hypothetical protein B0H12DRAFT_1082789 [Mycena haematopus]|nr:hypothetical protein B0H12DRAFT_1082789 [Mycena haematopus]
MCRNRKLIAFKERQRRSEKLVLMVGSQKARQIEEERDEKRGEKRDYEAEYAIFMARHEDRLREKVVNALWRREDGVLIRGNPVFHSARDMATVANETKNSVTPRDVDRMTVGTTTAFYLVVAPSLGGRRGVYTTWASAQRVSENVTRGGATKYNTWDECLPAWHTCCDEGEHDHPARPTLLSVQAAPSTPATPRASRAAATPNTLPRQRTATTSLAPISSLSLSPSTASSLSASPSSTISPAADVGESGHTPALDYLSMNYTVRGSGAVHTSLDAALDDFRQAGAAGDATLFMTEDPRIASNVAAGLSPQRPIVWLQISSGNS